MNIDMAALHAIEVDRGISVNELLETIKSALLTAYRHTQGHQIDATIDIDRKTGVVRVIAREVDEDGNVISEWDDTPEGFGRIAATTARQVMLQRFRDAENERTYGEFSTREGEIVAGVIQRDSRANARGLVIVRIGSETKASEGVIPAAEQVPGESYEHGDRVRCYVVGVTRGSREPLITLSRTHPNLVRKLFSLEVPEIADGSVEIIAVAREAGHRSKIAVASRVPGLNAKGACIGPMGQRVRNVMSELSGEKIDIIDYDDDPARFVANALSPAKVVSVSVIDQTGKAAKDLMGDEEGVRRVFESAGEGDEVSFVPGVLLGDEDLDDVELLAGGGVERIRLLRVEEGRRHEGEEESGEAEKGGTKGHRKSRMRSGWLGVTVS